MKKSPIKNARIKYGEIINSKIEMNFGVSVISTEIRNNRI